MIFYYGNIPIPVRTATSKKFTSHCGRKWVNHFVYIDAQPVKCWYDIKFGNHLYFEWKDRCRTLPLTSDYNAKDKYALNPLTEILQFKTTLVENEKSV